MTGKVDESWQGLQPDENGCYSKDGVWCPAGDGKWVRDDGKIWEGSHPHARFHHFCPRMLLKFAPGILILLLGLLWGFFERRRRRTVNEKEARTGSYVSRLCECFCIPRVCLPACLFTPFLAAFNRAEADERECNICDVCCVVLKPVAQYTTRQTIRGKYNLADDSTDMLSACCCTPCAVAQDTLELEKRASLQNTPVPATLAAPGMPVYVLAASAPPPAEIVLGKVDTHSKADEYSKADNQV